MNEKDLEKKGATIAPSTDHPAAQSSGTPPNSGGEFITDEPQMFVNEYGSTRDSAVVIDEADRTVLLTENETIIVEKEPHIDIAPKNRPRKVYGGMWGQAEIATVGLAVLAMMSVMLLYLLLVVPANRELEANRAERDRLELELASAKAKYGGIRDVEFEVAKLIASVDDFESRYLPIAATGRTSLYQRINGLIAGYGLVNTTGPDYSPLEIAGQNQNGQSDEERGRAKFQSLFPGVYVTMTVEGPYQNLRRFIREIETGNEFVVVSAVELEPSDAESSNTQNAPAQASANPQAGNPTMGGLPSVNSPGGYSAAMQQQQQYARPKGKTHGETVSLRLEMAAYFRRPNIEAPVVTQ